MVNILQDKAWLAHVRDLYAEELARAHTALRLTQEYLGNRALPNIAGWSHFDERVRIEKLLGDELCVKFGLPKTVED